MTAQTSEDNKALSPVLSAEEAYKQLGYTLPEWAATPPLSQHYYFNVIKDQVAIETVSINDMLHRKSHLSRPFANCCLLGRDDYCDHIMKHPSTSRVHCICVYNNIDKSIYLYDRSTNGVSVNQQRIPHKKHFKLGVGDFVTFGESTRRYQLQCGQVHPSNNNNNAITSVSAAFQSNTTPTTAALTTAINITPMANNNNNNHYNTTTTTTTTNNNNSKRTFSQFQQSNMDTGKLMTKPNAIGNRTNFLGHTQFAKSTLLEDKSMNSATSQDNDLSEPPNKIRGVADNDNNNDNDNQPQKDQHKTEIRKNFEKRLKDGKNISKFSALKGQVTMEEQEKYFFDTINKFVHKRPIGSG